MNEWKKDPTSGIFFRKRKNGGTQMNLYLCKWLLNAQCNKIAERISECIEQSISHATREKFTTE